MTASDDGTANLWNPSTGECAQTLTGHGAVVKSVGFFSRWHGYLGCLGDGAAKLWNPSTVECTHDRHEAV